MLIDAGNSRIKWRYQDSDGTRVLGGCDHADVIEQSWPEVARVLVSSVHDNPWLRAQLEQQFGNCLVWLSRALEDYPDFEHCYPQPGRLGVDRWLAMLGARQHRDGNLLVIDSGTALTIDLLSDSNRHLGGYIVPGLTLAQQSLWQNTERVRPYADEVRSEHLQPGTDTVGCVSAGVRCQQVAFVSHVISSHSQYQPFFTGGDGEWLAKNLGHSYWPELIFDGLDALCAGYFSVW
nr:type III pantothenate kinase [Oceanobacter mangrovi]